MVHYNKKLPTRCLVNAEQADMFLGLFDNDSHKQLAKCLFIDGMTCVETAEKVGYSVRHTERLRVRLIEQAVIKLLMKCR